MFAFFKSQRCDKKCSHALMILKNIQGFTSIAHEILQNTNLF